MVDLTRRKTIVGLGLLATGSGATFTSANFQSTAGADSDLRVLVERPGLEFKGNSDNSNDQNVVENPDFFEDGPSGDLDDNSGGAFDGDDDDNNAPLAYAEGTNGDLTLKTAVSIGEQTTFNDLFVVSNNSDESVTIGIAYDRNNADFDAGDNTGQYGTDINTNGTGLDTVDAQRIYQFVKSDNSDTAGITIKNGGINQPDGLLSPVPGDRGSGKRGVEGTGTEGTNIVDNDLPANAVTIDPGSELKLNLKVNAGAGNQDLRDRIENRADLNGSALGLQSDTVQIIDGITIVDFGDEVNDPNN